MEMDQPTAAAVVTPQHRKRSHSRSHLASSFSQVDTPSINGRQDKDSPRKQPKVSRACDVCKAKKAKCSGTLPCDGCTRKGLACVYDAKYSRGRPPTPPPAHPPPPPSIAVVDVDVPSRASPEVDMAEIEGQYFDPTSGLTFLHRAFKRLSSHKAEFAPHVSSGAEKQQPLMTAGDRPLECDDDGTTELPDRDTSMAALAYYFDTCVVTYHIFHQATIMGWLKAMLQNVQEGQPLQNGLGHSRASIVLSILAIVTFRQEKIRMRSEYPQDEARALRRSDPYFVAARALTDAETGLPRLESAQARLVQVLYLLQTARMNQGWYVFGITSQIMAALGLHRQGGRTRHNLSRSRSRSRADYINIQCRKRTFWVAYIIDNYLSVILGRPMQHRDEDIELDFPDCVNDEDMTPQGPSTTEAADDCYLDAMIFHAQLSQIVAKISREVYAIQHIPTHERIAAAHRSVSALHSWRASLPAHLGTVKPSSLIPRFRRQSTALKLAYCHAIIHAYRPFLLGQRGIYLHQATENAADGTYTAECVSAAKVALETVASMANDGSLFHAFWWTVYVTFCAIAVVYVCEIQQNRYPGHENDQLSLAQLSTLADRCLQHLDRATSVHSPSRRYSVVLEELRREARRQTQVTLDNDLGETVQVQAQTHVQSAPFDLNAAQMSGGLPDPPTDDSLHSTQDLWNGWQTTDWLDLDSSSMGFVVKLRPVRF
ncbi:hypothetical protein HMPREF1624_05727 [Sporothrix schenckii ATCC 58251]|uniref:Zn(2)-C6 fungal-type domain-containing protein n=1 Tax=Sporothrix schenckii (strain ATCC 58251 / de Perez 2211183) TaxID=1391915 RepID=U7PRK1_SPOS1|nr:hypothetical protein HMPREF1624_05727 [Sporothrix schenckii ATCC 58251]